VWYDDPRVLMDGDVIDISHFADPAFPENPLYLFKGLFYYCSSVCSKYSKRKLLHLSIAL
jgi:hypothetical protein